MALITLLTAPVCSLVTAFLQLNQSGNDLVIVFSFPSNGEDQHDSNDTEDTDCDSELTFNEYLSLIPLRSNIDRMNYGRDLPIRNHHLEIVTPPPES